MEKTPPLMRRRRWLPLLLLAAFVLCSAGVYRYIIHGGMRARQVPSALEASVAHWLLDASIPNEARAQRNPLSAIPGSADVASGQQLYVQHCTACHGVDGTGKTAAADGLFPPVVGLNQAAIAKRKRTDGEIFYLIRNGIRNTGMPGWQLPDQQTWQLVCYIRQLPITVAMDVKPMEAYPQGAHYAGSTSCKSCHAEIYERWVKTPMANVVRDPKVHPEAITPDLSKPDPLVKFIKEDIGLVYGSIWKQRYFKKVGDDYFPFPAQWDVTNKKWKPYHVKDDWWVAHYPEDNMERPTSALCDGCHSVNYDIKTKLVSEWNVGCEKCHGAGSEHNVKPTAGNIINPSRMNLTAANDTCIQCHSQGRPLQNPIEGKHYDWPVGFDMTKHLSDYWKLEDHKLGETTFTHFADGTAHKNRMQGNDYVGSQMYAHGVTCFTCHDAHGTSNPSSLRAPAQELCISCHTPGSAIGPRAPTLQEHTHHAPTSTGSQCISCHMPKIAQTLGEVNVRSHTFRFVSPAKTETDKIPNACNACHADKSTTWAADSLKSWVELSPWRVQ